MRSALFSLALFTSVALVAAGCSQGPSPQQRVLPRISSTEVSVGKMIRLTDAGPVPHHLIAGPGDTITWRNDMSAQVSIALIDGSKPSGLIKIGSDYARRFPDSGTFAYKLNGGKTVAGFIEINLPAPVPGHPA